MCSEAALSIDAPADYETSTIMLSISWMTTGLFAVAAVVFMALWLRSRSNAQSISGTSEHGHSHSLVEGVEYRLLAKQEWHDSNSTYCIGLVAQEGSKPLPFLAESPLDHISVGDQFAIKNGTYRRVEVKSAPRTTSSADASTTPIQEPQTNQQTSAPEQVDSDFTVMYSAAGAMDSERMDPFDGFAFLDVIEGPDQGIRFPLTFENSRIGRSESCEVTLSDDGSSRHHCEIVFENGDFILRDAGSTNGTLCNDQLVDVHRLEFGDVVGVSDTNMKFTCRGFETSTDEPAKAIQAYESCLAIEPTFILALKNLAFLLERDVARRSEAAPIWKQVAELERRR